MESETVNAIVTTSYKTILFVFGTIGNCLFVHLVYKRRQLRSRSSLLQCCQCIFHILCQLGTVLDGLFTLNLSMTREECFTRISFYIFFQSAQLIIMLVIMLDILVLVKWPLFYKSIRASTYFLSTVIPTLLYSLTIVIYGYLTTNEDPIPSCSPPMAFSLETSLVVKYLILALSTLTLTVFLILIRLSHRKGRTHNDDSFRIMKRLQFSVVIFILTWYVSQIVAYIYLQTDRSESWKRMLFSHNSFLIALSYSNTFYVAMWRSKEYRNHFLNVWALRKNASVVNVNTPSSHKLSTV